MGTRGNEAADRGEWMDQQIRDEQREREQARKRNRMRRRKQIRRRRICFLVLLALIAGGVMGLLNRDRPSPEAPAVAEINGIPVIQDYIAEGTPGRPGTKKKVKFIVIHETGNTGSNANAASHAAYLKTEAETEAKSWHYTVDDHEIYHHIPDNEVAFHAGDQLKEDGGNLNGIGIEMCVNPENDYDQTLKNTAALTAHLMKAYKLSIEDVKKHQDFSGKNCPENLIESGRWDEFIELVKASQ
ncbi:peptidoglycan recognition protein family protein [Bacilliculturomica massiliensis]|uniref:peptidoglycan recognition protein family protein n=1 Tax=Bacilliculturomica massiliensis TaxID=1917867 RepID=UPI00102F7540|nr:N-acetylmuramoyl-L-alanine amidase [Bacilliculturomica massiliensis]